MKNKRGRIKVYEVEVNLDNQKFVYLSLCNRHYQKYLRDNPSKKIVEIDEPAQICTECLWESVKGD